jgi:hypothetical protein
MLFPSIPFLFHVMLGRPSIREVHLVSPTPNRLNP